MLTFTSQFVLLKSVGARASPRMPPQDSPDLERPTADAELRLLFQLAIAVRQRERLLPLAQLGLLDGGLAIRSTCRQLAAGRRPSPPMDGGGASADRGRLRDADVAHTAEIVGRGGSGLVRRGTLQLPGGQRAIDVAIKTLHAGATESDERQFRKEFQVSLRASERCLRACRMYGYV